MRRPCPWACTSCRWPRSSCSSNATPEVFLAFSIGHRGGGALQLPEHTKDLAARLAALGEGDAVILGGETARRLDGEYGCEDWGERRLRNVEEPVRVFRVPVSLDAAAAPTAVA